MAGRHPLLRYFRFVRPDVRADANEEIGFHLAMRERDLLAQGLPPAAAKARAFTDFGDVAHIREQLVTIDKRRERREERRALTADIAQDIHFAARTLRRSPGFTFMAVLCIALGICATTTIFTAVNAMLIRPLPYPNSDQLVAIYAREKEKGWTGVNISYPDYVSWRDENRTLESLGMWTWTTLSLSGEGVGEPERVDGAQVSPNLFPLLGVSPLLGRPFTADEEKPGRDRVALLSYDLWQRRYAGDRAIIGRAITIDAQPYTVIGVMPPRFTFPDRGRVWTPLTVDPADGSQTGRSNRYFAGAIGRMKNGVTLERAQADFAALSARLQQAYPDENFGWDAEVRSLRDDLVGDLRRPLLVFLGAVGLVLLIACANVANLMLARGAARAQEIAVRLSLGARRSRIVRQVLTESLMVAVLGGVIGASLARFGIKVLYLAFPNGAPYYFQTGVDALVVSFAAVVTAVTGLIFGLAPALATTRPQIQETLREGGRGGEARRRTRTRGALVVAEVALSVVLLIGATLLIRSYVSLMHTDLGFDRAGIVTARVSLPEAKYGTREARRTFWETLLQKVAAIPGVETVGSANGIPFSGWDVQAGMEIEGQPSRGRGEELVAHYQYVSPDFFRAIGVPLVRGRALTAADRDTAVHVGVINDLLAQREFKGEDPIGKRIRIGSGANADPWVTIVGVVRTFRHYRLPQEMGPALYFPLLPRPSFTQTLVVRTRLAKPDAIIPSLREVVRGVDPDLPIYEPKTMEEAVSRSLWRQRFQGQVLGIFAVLALVLAAVGIYGVIAWSVAQRTRELGVRMALGATRPRVVGMVLRQGTLMVAVGVGIGLVAAFGLTRLLATLLYGVHATDLFSFSVVPLVLTLVALLASYLPARRASRVDPVTAMRAE